MRISKLHYVFSFIFILFIGLSEPGFAQKKGKIQKGSATWYGSRYHGRKTTSGEVYNKNAMTAAHLSLPFGTKVKVTNLESKKSVIVRINDRGPFGNKNRVIDLSEAAAKKIGLYRNGYGKVEVEVLSPNVTLEEVKPLVTAIPVNNIPEDLLYAPLATSYFVIQAGAFSDAINAKQQSEKLKALADDLPIAFSEELINGKKVHRIVAGRFTKRAEAEKFKVKLQQRGITALVKQVPSA